MVRGRKNSRIDLRIISPEYCQALHLSVERVSSPQRSLEIARKIEVAGKTVCFRAPRRGETSRLSSIILWFVRGLWPIISERVEQYGAAVTVPVSVAVVRYQHLPRKAARFAYPCAWTRAHTHTRVQTTPGQHNLRQLRIQSFTLIASTPSNICSRRKGDRVTFIKWMYCQPERMDYAFPHGNSLLNVRDRFHGIR